MEKRMVGLWILTILAVICFTGTVSGYTPIGGGICDCNSCADCTNAFNDPVCTNVRLNADIIDANVPIECILMNTNASNKVFDCQNHQIDALAPTMADGIKVKETAHTITNVIIKNCRINEWFYGIHFEGIMILNTFITDSKILDNNITNSDFAGIALSNSDRNHITNNNIQNSDSISIIMNGCSQNNISGNIIIAGHMANGIHVSEGWVGSTNNILDSNIISVFGATAYGFYESGDTTRNNIFSNNRVTGGRGGLFFNPGTGGNGDIVTSNIFCGQNLYGIEKQTSGTPTGSLNKCDAALNWQDIGAPPGMPCMQTCAPSCFTIGGGGVCTVDPLSVPPGETGCSCLQKAMDNASCTTVTLSRDITNADYVDEYTQCFTMNANATNKILDCQNHQITAPPGFGHNRVGIRVGSFGSYPNNIVIRNCKVNNWDHDIILYYTNNSKVMDNTITGYATGVLVQESYRNQIVDNYIEDTDFNCGVAAIMLLVANQNNVSRNTINMRPCSDDGINIIGQDNIIDSNVINMSSLLWTDHVGIRERVNSSGNNKFLNNRLIEGEIGLFFNSSTGGNGDIVSSNIFCGQEFYGIQKDTSGTPTGSSNWCDDGLNWNDTDAPIGMACAHICTGSCFTVDGGGVCTVDPSFVPAGETGCSCLQKAMNNVTCITVKLLGNIINANDMPYCVNMSSGKTLDCQAHLMDGVNNGNTDAVYAKSINNAVVKNCKFTDWMTGVSFFSGVTNSVIENNTVSGCRNGLSLASGSNNNRISNNSVDTFSVYAVNVFQSDLNLFSENIINHSALSSSTWNIENSSSNTFTSNNIFSSSSAAEIFYVRLSSSNNDFSGNNVSGAFSAGIHFLSDSKDNRVISNIICGGEAISNSSGQPNTGSSNKCDSASNWQDSDAAPGFPCSQICTSVPTIGVRTINCNNFEIVGNNSGTGIWIKSNAGINITNCKFSKFDVGINITGNNVTISDSQFCNNTRFDLWTDVIVSISNVICTVVSGAACISPCPP